MRFGSSAFFSPFVPPSFGKAFLIFRNSEKLVRVEMLRSRMHIGPFDWHYFRSTSLQLTDIFLVDKMCPHPGEVNPGCCVEIFCGPLTFAREARKFRLR